MIKTRMPEILAAAFFLLTVCLTACLTGPAPAARAQESAGAVDTLPYKYQGNLISRKFHRPRCPFARVMSESKKVRFHFRFQAISQGYCPCRYCLPPTWTSVQAVIKSGSPDSDIIDKHNSEAGSFAKDTLNTIPLGTGCKSPSISSP